MPYLFDNLDAVRKLLDLSPFGLITDIDGTISEIAPYPDEARVSPICREQLAILSRQLELVAAISGRPALEARDMIGIDGMVYIGNHGLERWEDGVVKFVDGLQGYTEKVVAAQDELRTLLAMDGITFEDKGVALAIHYRSCLDPESARRSVLETIRASAIADEFQTMEGKMVVELRPHLRVNKGTAVEALITGYRLKSGIYLGDDSSDVDAFTVMHQGELKGLALAVTGEETPHQVAMKADYSLNGVSDVERFLIWLAGAVPAPRK